MTEYLSPWMRMPDAGAERLGLSCVRMARHEIRWWYERFSEHDFAPRFEKILDELDDLEQLCLTATSTTAQSAEANAGQAGTAATPTT